MMSICFASKVVLHISFSHIMYSCSIWKFCWPYLPNISDILHTSWSPFSRPCCKPLMSLIWLIPRAFLWLPSSQIAHSYRSSQSDHFKAQIRLNYSTAHKSPLIPKICGDWTTHFQITQVKEVIISREIYIFKYMKTKTIYQNLWDTVKAVLREKCMALNTSIRKEKKN